MIQRIQSVFLLIAVLAGILLFFFPLAGIYSPTATYHFYIYEFRNMVPGEASVIGKSAVLPLVALNVLSTALAAYAITLYKKRITQIKMVRLSIFFDVVLIALIFFVYGRIIEKNLNVTPDYPGEAGIYFPLIMLVFLILAQRFIIRDERLVRSIDRLR
jgi:hypothetical protein